MRVTIFLIAFLLLPLVSAAIINPIGNNTAINALYAQRDTELARIIVEQQTLTRAEINATKQEFRDRVIATGNEIEGRVQARLREFKFTLPITLAACVFITLEIHDLLSKRRQRKYLKGVSMLPPTPQSAEETLLRNEKESLNSNFGIDQILPRDHATTSLGLRRQTPNVNVSAPPARAPLTLGTGERVQPGQSGFTRLHLNAVLGIVFFTMIVTAAIIYGVMRGLQ